MVEIRGQGGGGQMPAATRRAGLLRVVIRLLATIAVAASPVLAGTLEVKSAAAYLGAFGLEVNLGPCSPTDLVITAPPTVSGSFTGCETLAATGVEVVSPGAAFRAGREISLGHGFVVGPDAPFAATIVEELTSPFAFVEDHSPQGLSSYLAIFHVKLDGLSLAPGDEVRHLIGYAATGDELFRVTLLRNSTLNENRLILEARRDDGSFARTPFGEQLLLPAGYNEVAIRWVAQSGTGHLLAGVNSALPAGLTTLANGSGRLEYIRWGAVSGTLTSTTGTLRLDEFKSYR